MNAGDITRFAGAQPADPFKAWDDAHNARIKAFGEWCDKQKFRGGKRSDADVAPERPCMVR